MDFLLYIGAIALNSVLGFIGLKLFISVLKEWE